LRIRRGKYYYEPPLKRVFGKIKLKQQFEVSWCHQYIDTPRDRPSANGKSIITARAPVQSRQEIALLSES
jgi:hypothetical protein